MKKIKIKENELVELIEKLVKENIGFVSSAIGNGNGQNFGLMGTPTAKYKDLLEKDDIEEDDIDDNEDEVSEQADDTLNINVDDETQDGLNQEDYMESVKESRLISRLKKRLTEEKGKGCAESEGGSGCIKKGSYTDKSGKKYSWHILNNKKGGIWKGCTSKKDCESILDAFHANS
tara:strand:+ start:16402 stop:16929 length:528 start_codon:yes stop_codon:yes gene_type:complete